jgi:hypothetical protein
LFELNLFPEKSLPIPNQRIVSLQQIPHDSLQRSDNVLILGLSVIAALMNADQLLLQISLLEGLGCLVCGFGFQSVTIPADILFVHGFIR